MTLRFEAIIRSVEAKLQINVLTYDYDIISCFFDDEALTTQQLSEHSRASNTAFYAILKKLELKGVVYAEQNPNDKRSKIYRLSDNTLRTIKEDRYNFSQWFNKDTYLPENGNNALKIYSRNIKKDLKIKHLTCDYQILIYLYGRGGITNIQFTDLVDVSVTNFNNSLRKLGEMGLIYSEKDKLDKRCKHYYLTDRARQAVDEAQKNTFEWVASKWSVSNS